MDYKLATSDIPMIPVWYKFASLWKHLTIVNSLVIIFVWTWMLQNLFLWSYIMESLYFPTLERNRMKMGCGVLSIPVLWFFSIFINLIDRNNWNIPVYEMDMTQFLKVCGPSKIFNGIIFIFFFFIYLVKWKRLCFERKFPVFHPKFQYRYSLNFAFGM